MNERQHRILAIGECMVEMAPRGDGAYTRNFAGDTFNTAWYLRRLLPETWSVDYCSAVGEDRISDHMITFMQEAGIGTDSVRRISGRTVGLYMIELDNGERSFSYWRGQSAAKLLARDREVLSAALAETDVALFSGITLAILSEEDRRNLLESLAEARRRGTVVAFDPNMRLRLWPDVAVMCAAVTEAAAVADIVLPSFDEDGQYYGETSPLETIARYRNAGASTIVVKNGVGRIHAEGRDEGVVTFDPQPAAEVVDTTAAGDSFNAGFLAARLAGASLGDAIGRGSQVAAQVIGKRGALVDIDV